MLSVFGYMTYGLVKTVNVWQQGAILEILSSSYTCKYAKGGEDGEARQRGGKIHGGTMTLVSWSDAASGDQSAQGKCRPGYVSGLTSPYAQGATSYR